MGETLPMFPLNTVVFPGVRIPLRVFEDRYRALVRHLLGVEDPAARLFGSVGIREGYEVGDHGSQSVYRIGCRLRLTTVTDHPDGTFDVVATGMDRFRLESLHTDGPFPAGDVEILASPRTSVAPRVVADALAAFDAYRAVVTQWRDDPHPTPLPSDPVHLSWTLAAVAPLALPERQELLESDDASGRLTEVTHLLRREVEAMRAIASLPATQVARTRWCPN